MTYVGPLLSRGILVYRAECYISLYTEVCVVCKGRKWFFPIRRTLNLTPMAHKIKIVGPLARSATNRWNLILCLRYFVLYNRF